MSPTVPVESNALPTPGVAPLLRERTIRSATKRIRSRDGPHKTGLRVLMVHARWLIVRRSVVWGLVKEMRDVGW